ncbi:TonB-dependent receptor plug domain-containing protein [Undibacterium sp. Ji50W]|uniref:TonB-dependent receptor plug domain-containing protein n=1 Tax=Undibacterium sp. Ji50W TaxID=3413041 RepID=UPI003BEFF654
MKNRTKMKKAFTASLMLATGMSSPIFASATPQDRQAEPGTSETKTQQVVVTGSSMPVDPDKVAVSVVMVDAEQMAKTGVSSNLLDILRKQIPSFQGRGNAGSSNANNTNQNTAGGSQVQLRNLDTLILVNGRRLAISSIAGIGGKAFVDVNQIPPSAIERIEVLPDGSSAIYGSDAIGGVVNIILKSNYNGAELNGRYATANDYSEQSTSFTLGKNLGAFNLTVSGSESSNTPLYQRQRPFSTPITGRISVVPGTIGGASPGILAASIDTPGNNNPTGAGAISSSIAALFANGTYVPASTAGIANSYDISQFQTLLLKQEQRALSANLTGDLIPKKLSLFADAEVSRNKSFTQFLPITTTLTVPAGAPSNPLNTNFSGVNFAYWPLPRQFNNDAETSRATIGLRSNLGDGWGWETAYVHSQNDLQQRQSNVIYKTNLPLAVAGGYDANGNAVAGGAYSKVYSGFSKNNALVLQPALDPFARSKGVNIAALANVYGTEVIDTSSQLDSFDASVHGYVMKLPAGKLGFAAGISSRKESLSAHTDPNGNNTGATAQQWIGGTYADAFDKSRTVDAVYAEFRAPITSATWALPGLHALDLVGAYRYERYSDAGEATVPKIGFRWQPFSAELTVRGAYSKSYTAPTLFAKYGPTDTRTVGSGVITTVFGIANPGFNGEDGNNPGLEASKSQTRSLSFSWEPNGLPGLTLGGEYHDVSQRGYPGGIGFTNILQSVDQQGSASPFSANLAKGNFPGLPGAIAFTNPGELGNYLRADPNNANNVYAIDRFTNLGGLRVKSYSINAEYEMPTDAGAFSISTAGTIFSSYQFQALPYQKFYEYAGTATNGGTGVQGTLPKYRFYTVFGWKKNNWDLTIGNTYVSAVTDLGAGGLVYETSTTLKPMDVSSYSSWDIRLAYSGEHLMGKYGKAWTVAFGVNNITNKMPPLSPQAFTDNNADAASYSPIGRLYYLTANAKF